jgi:hypothetical protein
MYLWEELPYLDGGSVRKQVLLEASPVTEQKARRSLVHDVSRQQIERAVDLAQTFGVNQAVFAFGRRALGLMKKTPEILACCFAIPRLVCAADHDVHTSPMAFSKVIAPPRNDSVQLLQLAAHCQLRSLKGLCCQCADVFLESIEINISFRENSVD